MYRANAKRYLRGLSLGGQFLEKTGTMVAYEYKRA